MFDLFLIKIENNNPRKAICIIFDNHYLHLKNHIRYFYKSGMVHHLLEHIKCWRYQYKKGLPVIDTDRIVKYVSRVK